MDTKHLKDQAREARRYGFTDVARSLDNAAAEIDRLRAAIEWVGLAGNETGGEIWQVLAPVGDYHGSGEYVFRRGSGLSMLDAIEDDMRKSADDPGYYR